jgi:hypothetical protein
MSHLLYGDIIPGEILIASGINTVRSIPLSTFSGGGGITNHSLLSNLDYASAGHTGFEPTITKGDLTEITSDILTISGGTGAVIGAGVTIAVDQADISHAGYLTSGDWGTFNAKQPAGNYITGLTSDVLATGPGDVAATIASGAVTLPKMANLTGPTVIGRDTGTGVPLALTPAQVRAVTGLADITSDPTGFSDPSAVIINYDSTTQKVTLTGTWVAYWKGQVITALTNGWVSEAHPNTTGHIYRLVYDGSNFSWLTDINWSFNQFQIASVDYGATNKYAIRECHGLLPWQAHEIFHDTIGTYRESGGTLDPASYALSSTTVTDRRPNVVQTVIHDEDILTTLPTLTSKLYTKVYLTGTGTLNYTVETAEIIPLSTNQPYYNQYTGGAWQQTLMTLNTYTCVWLVSIPVTSDAGSQKYRYLWIQGQSAGTLAAMQSLQPSDVSIGTLSIEATEFVFLQKIIINYQAAGGGNWVITSVTNLSGNHWSQVGSPAGTYLSDVTTDTTLTGNGTISSPLSLADAAVTLAKMANIVSSGIFYRKSAGTGTPEVNTLATLKTDLGLTGTNTGDQTITLTGAVTGSGTGSIATTIATPGTLSVGSINSTVTSHTHAISSLSNPGTNASLLATDASGNLTIAGLLKASANTASSDTVTGAFQVVGGVGIGGRVNTGGIIFVNLTGGAAAPITTQGISVANSGDNATIEIQSYAGSPVLVGYRFNGTPASKTAVASGNNLMLVGGAGYNGTANTGSSSLISIIATEDWSTTAYGSKIVFATTPNTTTGRVTAVTIGQDQSLTAAGNVILPSTSGTNGYGLKFDSGANGQIAVFQALDAGGASYLFYATNRYYDGSNWQQLNTRVGGDLQISGDTLDYYSFAASSSTPVHQLGLIAGNLRLYTGAIIIGGTTTGVSSHTSFTNVTSSTVTNTYLVRGGQAANTVNTGWIKIYVGTTACWVPYWANATP